MAAQVRLLTSTQLGSSNGGASVTTSAIDTTGANLLIVAAASQTGTTITDSKSNTWTPTTKYQTGTNNGSIQLFYCYNGTVGSGHTFTATSGFPSIEVFAFEGAASSPFDQENGASSTVAGTSLSSGNITPSQNYSILIGACDGGAVRMSLPSTNSLFGMTKQVVLDSGQHYAIMAACGLQGTAAAIDFNPTYLSSGDRAVSITSFKTNFVEGTIVSPGVGSLGFTGNAVSFSPTVLAAPGVGALALTGLVSTPAIDSDIVRQSQLSVELALTNAVTRQSQLTTELGLTSPVMRISQYVIEWARSDMRTVGDCTGGGLVPTAPDLTDTENWA